MSIYRRDQKGQPAVQESRSAGAREGVIAEERRSGGGVGVLEPLGTLTAVLLHRSTRAMQIPRTAHYQARSALPRDSLKS